MSGQFSGLQNSLHVFKLINNKGQNDKGRKSPCIQHNIE